MLTMMKRLPEDTVFDIVESPVGKLYLFASKKGLHAILWQKDAKEKEFKDVVKKLKKSSTHKVIIETRKQLREYFAKKRTKFDLPLVADGTEFQKKAWMQLRKIPYGKTISYQDQAAKLGDLKKARAVGTANSKNPLSIVVPCHRVIAKSGSLSGFGGGLSNKKYLLELEK